MRSHDLVVTARLVSIATTWVKPMLAVAKRHKSAGLEHIYMLVFSSGESVTGTFSGMMLAKEAASASVMLLFAFRDWLVPTSGALAPA